MSAVRQFETQPTRPIVLVIINESILPRIADSIEQYQQDLHNDGYDTVIFSSSGGTPFDLKTAIIRQYNQAKEASLDGVILIGNLPVPWYEMDDDFYGYAQFPIDLYYMDLNGEWSDTDGDGILDLHNDGSGDRIPEIWLGRLTANTLNGSEEELLRKYFYKNHQYRIGNINANGNALLYVDDDWEFYADGWKAEIDTSENFITTVAESHITSAEDYKFRLKQMNEWVIVAAHSSPFVHSFSPAGGLVTNDEIQAIKPGSLFYNLFACSNARYTEENYMGGWYIFSEGIGLGAVGSTKTGSMLSFADFFNPFGDGKTLGESYKQWFISRAPYDLNDRQWYYGMTLLGDPTLKKKQQLLLETDDSWRAIGPSGNQEGTPLASVGEPWESANLGWNFDLNFGDSNTMGWTNAIFNHAPGEPSRPDILGHIWVDDPFDDARVGSTPSYFRKQFWLKEKPKHGRLTILTDDDAQVWINGHLAVDDQSGGVNIITNVDITPYLQMGSNLVAVKAHDSFGIFESLFLSLRSGPQGPVNSLVEFKPLKQTTTSDVTDCPTGYEGKFQFDARLTNIERGNPSTSSALFNVLVEITQLTNGNILLTDGTLKGTGNTFAVPLIGQYADGILGPSESVNVPFTICLKNRSPFRFFVNILARE